VVAGFPAVRSGKLLSRVVCGSTKNISFEDFCALIEALGFELDRTRGSHRLYYHRTVQERLNVQPLESGEAKPYQIRQLLRLVEQYDLEVRGG
jgi:predicted RNA binding protein YcfA (HicA-like mRNA interferase family)